MMQDMMLSFLWSAAFLSTAVYHIRGFMSCFFFTRFGTCRLIHPKCGVSGALRTVRGLPPLLYGEIEGAKRNCFSASKEIFVVGPAFCPAPIAIQRSSHIRLTHPKRGESCALRTVRGLPPLLYGEIEGVKRNCFSASKEIFAGGGPVALWQEGRILSDELTSGLTMRHRTSLPQRR